MHARYHLTITPPLPAAAQAAACRIGAARFDEFAAQVGRRIDRDKPLIREALDRLGAKNHERPSHEGQGPLRDVAEREHPVARETLNGHSVDADETPVVSELSGRGAAPGRFPPRPAMPPTNPADGGVLQPDGPQAESQTPGQGDGDGTRPSIEDRASGLQLILRVFLPFTIGYYLSYLFRTISAVTAEPLTAEFSLSPSSLGLLTSAYFFTFAVAQIPIGVFLDRYGPRQVQAVLLVIAAGGAALFGASDGFLLASRWPRPDRPRCRRSVGRRPESDRSVVSPGACCTRQRLDGHARRARCRDRNDSGRMAAGLDRLARIVRVARHGDHGRGRRRLSPRARSTAVAFSGESHPFAGLREIYTDPHFWRLAPLSATTIGTAWALQGLWAAPWFRDVEGLDRAALVNHLLAMAVALSIGALLLGVLATRLRRRNVEPQAIVGAVAALFITVQTALILRWPLPSYVLWCLIAAAGAVTVLSYAVLASHFPKELAGRANAALNVIHIGGAFVVQELIGIIIERWPVEGTHHPMIAYQVAFGVDLALQLAAWIWFMWPRTQTAVMGSPRRYSVQTMSAQVMAVEALASPYGDRAVGSR